MAAIDVDGYRFDDLLQIFSIFLKGKNMLIEKTYRVIVRVGNSTDACIRTGIPLITRNGDLVFERNDVKEKILFYSSSFSRGQWLSFMATENESTQ